MLMPVISLSRYKKKKKKSRLTGENWQQGVVNDEALGMQEEEEEKLFRRVIHSPLTFPLVNCWRTITGI